ncbi:MAG: aminotransferase class V-fold PLP-dependent enzyme [Acidobacteria bacterium]|nr:aminotransferase class V-fold PLP-dependent enzyme [Acidobacteriota bacterium]
MRAPMLEHWLLDPEIVFLNHGSFGAAPKVVLAEQTRLRERMEREPVIFFVRKLEEALDAVRERIARLVGASFESIALVPNATTAVNSVLSSIDFRPGDEILVTDQEYNACRNVIDRVAQRSGAVVKVVEIPFEGVTEDGIVDAILERVTDRSRLLLIDHIVSQTAIIFPVHRICREMSRRNVETLVDGAHAVGMVPLELDELGAAWYTSNCHKWLCAPKGSAFLHTREDRRSMTRPAIISHGANSPRTDRSRYLLEFDWTGTFDPTAWLATGAAIDFMEKLHPEGIAGVARENHELVLKGYDILCRALRIDPPVPREMFGSMAAVRLPDGSGDAPPTSLYGDPIQDELLEKFRIEVPVVAWPAPPSRLLRVSAQMYNDLSDYEALAAALTELLEKQV